MGNIWKRDNICSALEYTDTLIWVFRNSLGQWYFLSTFRLAWVTQTVVQKYQIFEQKSRLTHPVKILQPSRLHLKLMDRVHAEIVLDLHE